MLRARDFGFRPVCFIGLLSALTVNTAMAESVLIKRKFEAGSSYLFESKAHATRVMTGMPNVPKGESMKMNFDTVLCRREQVKDGAMGKKEVTATFDRAVQVFDIPMMGGTLEFDSDDAENEEAAPLLATIFGPMVGESIKYEVGRDGKVLNFSGMDEIAKKIDAKATMNMFWTEMKNEFTNKTARRQYAEDPLLIYPGKEVAVGETWTATSKHERPRTGTVVENTTYKLDRIGTENGRKVAFISYTIDESSVGGDVDKKADDAKGEKKGGATRVKGSGKGKAIYDIELGMIVSNKSESKSDIRMPLSEMGGGEGTMKISIAVETNTRLISEADRNKQKEEAAQKIAARKKAQEEEEADDDDDDDDDSDDDDDDDSDDE